MVNQVAVTDAKVHQYANQVIPDTKVQQCATPSMTDPVEVCWDIPDNSFDCRLKYESDGSLIVESQHSFLLLRKILDHSIGCRYFTDYLTNMHVYELYECWNALKDFNSAKDGKFVDEALSLYDKFILDKDFFNWCNLDITPLKSSIEFHQSKPRALREKIDPQTDICDIGSRFLGLQHECFVLLHNIGWLEFIGTKSFREMSKHIRNTHNSVRDTDFEYYNVLGHGGFGVVVSCRKKSTGKRYAMKIQSKVHLYRVHALRNIAEICQEKNILCGTSHPFIVELGYSFQNKDSAMLVISLCLYDLGAALRQTDEQRFSSERVIFYATELTSALCYLHDRGLIHRDVKPGNVFVQPDGHIMLGDLGSVIDVKGNISNCCNELLSSYNDNEHLSNVLFGRNIHHQETLISQSCTKDTEDLAPEKAFSAVGTIGK